MTTLREAAQQALRAAEQGATVSSICILRAALAEPDLSRCPSCGGPADNGHDRCMPPNPYVCTKCMAQDDWK